MFSCSLSDAQTQPLIRTGPRPQPLRPALHTLLRRPPVPPCAPCSETVASCCEKMEDSQRKGTVTTFPVEEVKNAVKHVQDNIAEKNTELHRLQGFVTDNNNLINLVQKLPEQLSHDIMVPFGKAAFFPGRLIHTNEFLVLLGEGYYADRTSKQTVEILQRRGKSLDSQVDSLQAVIKNLELEASHFNELGEGIAYIEEEEVDDSNEEESESGPPKEDAASFVNEAKDVDFATIWSRLDELEKEELAAENSDDGDQNEETTADFDVIPSQRPPFNNQQNQDDIHQAIPPDQTNNRTLATELLKKHNHQENIADQLNFASLALQSQVKEREKIAQNVKSTNPSQKPPILPKEKISQTTSTSRSEGQQQASRPSFDSRKAFTGSIIEHSENLKTTSSSASSQVSGSQSSKPVSRFKMQRR